MELTFEVDPANSLYGGMSTITVVNRGPARATNIQVQREAFYSSLFYYNEVVSQGIRTGFNWEIASLEVGETATWKAEINLVDQYHTGYVYAQITAGDQPDPDSTPGSDTLDPYDPNEDDEGRILLASPGGGIPGSPDLDMVANTTMASLGEQVTFTLTLDNTGKTYPYLRDVESILPVGLDFISADASTGVYDPITGIWEIPYLAERTLPGTNTFFTVATLDITATVTQADIPLTLTAYTLTFSSFADTASVTINGTGPACPTDIPGFTVLGDYNDHRYFISNEKATWNSARTEAQTAVWELATIESAAENEFLRSNIADIAFIGLSDASMEGTLEWASGEPLTYSNLNTACGWCGLNNEQNDYVNLLFWDGTWGFDNQWVERRYLIEVDCSNSNMTTIPPASMNRQGINKAQYRLLEIENVFPVPTENYISIQLFAQRAMETDMIIYNAQGMQLNRLTFQLDEGFNQITTDVSRLPNGLHYVRFDISERHDPVRFIKIKE